ncbi:MAG: lytic transglycosylase domain-containing protein [Bacteroidota bacterium]
MKSGSLKRISSAGIYFLTGVLSVAAIWVLFNRSTTAEKEEKAYRDAFRKHYAIYALKTPEQLTFAGEDVPVHLLDVAERLDRELLINTYWQSQTMLFLKRSHKWFGIIEPILQEEGIPEDFKYLPLAESGLMNIVSPAGAAGPWQFLPKTGRTFGLEVNDEVDERYHLEKATRAACAYLHLAKEQLGSWTLAAASYNMGLERTRTRLEQQQVNNYYDLLLNSETSRYVFRIIALREILEHPRNYGFIAREQDLYDRVETYEVPVEVPISNLATFARENGINYRVLKSLNPWLRKRSLQRVAGKEYRISLPDSAAIPTLIADTTALTGSRERSGN